MYVGYASYEILVSFLSYDRNVVYVTYVNYESYMLVMWTMWTMYNYMLTI